MRALAPTPCLAFRVIAPRVHDSDLQTAFVLRRKANERGLSLYRCDFCGSARDALQHTINSRRDPPTPDATPETLLAAGYRVAVIDLDVFERCGFRRSGRVDRGTGHLEVLAPSGCADRFAAFEEHADVFAAHATITLKRSIE